MSRGDTFKQKIKRNIEDIFRKSELLAKKYPNIMAFDYVKAWCHMVVLHHVPIYTIDFDDEIEMFEEVLKVKSNDKFLKSYYACIIKINEMIKKKYENKKGAVVDGLRQSIREMKLIREGRLPKRDITSF